MWWLVVFGWAFAQEPRCPEEPRATVERAAQRALDAYDMADGVALELAERELADGLRCMSAPVPPELALRVHHAQALISFAGGEPARVRRSLAAVFELDPSFQLNRERFPESHPMWGNWEAAKRVESELERIGRVPPGGWVIDGSPTELAPLDRAFVGQALGKRKGGRAPVVRTEYCNALTDLTISPYPLHPELRAQRQRKIRRIGSVLSAALLAGGAASFGLAWRDKNAVLTDPTYADIEKRAVRANTEANVALGLAAGGLTVGVATWTIRW